MKMERKLIVIIGLTITVLLLTGCIQDTETNDIVENNKEINWRLYRDLFTPMYNDSVAVENAGYQGGKYNVYNYSVVQEGGWLFWVNHSRVLNSYYFPNQKDYLVKITFDGDIELIN